MAEAARRDPRAAAKARHAWIALVGTALAAAAHGQPAADPVAADEHELRYAVRPDAQDRVVVTTRDGALGLAVQRLPAREGGAVGGASNGRLFPAQDPTGRSSARLVRIDAEVSGFTVVVDYLAPQGRERFALGFRAAECGADPAADAGASAPAAGPCAWPLRTYRRERTDPQGRLVSGIVADYGERRARIFEGPGQPLRPPMPAVALRDAPAPALQDLPSVFDFSPPLEITLRHRP